MAVGSFKVREAAKFVNRRVGSETERSTVLALRGPTS
jgi:hypothetical protein